MDKNDILTVKIIKGIIIVVFITALLIFFFGDRSILLLPEAEGRVVTKTLILNVPIDKQVRELDLMLTKIISALQSNLRFGSGTDGYMGENIQGQFQVVTTAAADTEFTVAHTLGYAPTCYIILSNDKAGVVYKSGTDWTSTIVYLKCSVATSTLTLFLF